VIFVKIGSEKGHCSVTGINEISLISGLRRDVDELCGLLGNYTASFGNYLPTFRDNVLVPSSRVKFPREKKRMKFRLCLYRGDLRHFKGKDRLCKVYVPRHRAHQLTSFIIEMNFVLGLVNQQV
jgi:hypothetical protein